MISEKQFGQIIERTGNLVKKVDELKEDFGKNFDKVDTKFKELRECIDRKFDKHNKHHFQQEKKYVRWFLILAALTIGSLITNPENAVFAWSLIVRAYIGVF